jgi:hypothetical protein
VTRNYKPPHAARLRQSLGYILGKTPDDLVEKNPTLVELHVNQVRRAIEVLSQVVALHDHEQAEAA